MSFKKFETTRSNFGVKVLFGYFSTNKANYDNRDKNASFRNNFKS